VPGSDLPFFGAISQPYGCLTSQTLISINVNINGYYFTTFCNFGEWAHLNNIFCKLYTTLSIYLDNDIPLVIIIFHVYMFIKISGLLGDACFTLYQTQQSQWLVSEETTVCLTLWRALLFIHARQCITHNRVLHTWYPIDICWLTSVCTNLWSFLAISVAH
jgi:hypothetical protein